MDVHQGAKKSHQDRKNYRMAELHKQVRLERNQQRGKQIWVGGNIRQGGHWRRERV
jgi:hypothetical protein